MGELRGGRAPRNNSGKLFPDSGGDTRTLKGVTRVVDDVLHNPALFEDVLRAMADEDEIVRMRAGDAAEKISA